MESLVPALMRAWGVRGRRTFITKLSGRPPSRQGRRSAAEAGRHHWSAQRRWRSVSPLWPHAGLGWAGREPARFRRTAWRRGRVRAAGRAVAEAARRNSVLRRPFATPKSQTTTSATGAACLCVGTPASALRWMRDGMNVQPPHPRSRCPSSWPSCRAGCGGAADRSRAPSDRCRLDWPLPRHSRHGC